jgi:TolB-like protein/Tfp pilus assembly protein PilF
MRVELTEGEQARHWIKIGTDNLKAFEKNYQGLGFMRRSTKQDNDTARQLFEEAVALDPKFVGPYVNLGWTHFFDMRFGWSQSPAKSLQQAFQWAQKAVAMEEAFDLGHSLLASIYLVMRQHDKAIAEGERAVALNPNGATAYVALAGIAGCAGKWKESISYSKQAIRLSPFSESMDYWILGRSYFMTGQYEEAILTLKKAVRTNLDFLPAHIFLAACYSSLGRDAEATVAAKEILRINPKFSIESYAKTLPYKKEADIEREVTALRKAGLPEKPSASIPPSPEVAPKEKVTSPLPEKATKPTLPPAPKMEVASKEKMAFPLPDKPSIAVLPFTNMSGEKELEYFSDGLAEGIINGLSKSEHIFVIARNSTFTYKGKPVKVKQVAEEMGVRYVIEGSVQQERNRVRITVQLIDALTGRHLFSERYDRDLRDILNLQDEITMKVLTAVQVRLTMGEVARLSEKGTKNLDAYLKVLQGREIKTGTMNKERIERAMQLFEEAIALDPGYALAYSWLSTTHFDLVVLGASETPRESLQRAVELGKKAIALDESNSHVHSLLVFPYMYLREFDKAISEAEKAVSLCPNSASAYFALGTALCMAVRPQEAIPMLKKSLRLSPIPVHSQVLGLLASSYSMLGQYEEAIATYKKVLQLYGPDHLMAHLGLAVAYASIGREDEARAEGAEVLRIDPKFSLERYIKGLPFDQSRKDRMADALRKAGLK